MDRDARIAGARDAELGRLRGWRVREFSREASPLFLALRESLRRRERAGGASCSAWEAVCPQELLARTRVEGLRGGVLTVLAEDASTRYALDRALRTGLEETLIRTSAAPIRRVRVRLAP